MTTSSWMNLYLNAHGGPVILCTRSNHDFIAAVTNARKLAIEVKKDFWVYEGDVFYWADEKFPKLEGIKIFARVTLNGKIEWRNALKFLHDKPPETELCPECLGAGEVAGDYFTDDGMTTCQTCGGKGEI